MAQTSPITPEFRAQCVREARETGNATLVARRHGLSPRKVQQWVHDAQKALRAQPPDTDWPLAVQQTEAENIQLKQLLGEKDLEIAILKDLLKKVNRAPQTGVK